MVDCLARDHKDRDLGRLGGDRGRPIMMIHHRAFQNLHQQLVEYLHLYVRRIEEHGHDIQSHHSETSLPSK